MNYWWQEYKGNDLLQGDLLPDCLLPVFRNPDQPDDVVDEIDVKSARLIIVTQSCDLSNKKIEFVALCLVHTLVDFEKINPKMRGRQWENVRKGRVEGLHLLASPDFPVDNRKAYVVDFGHIVSLPINYLYEHAESIGFRWRLKSPFLEHFSQGFARFFMRVGLPSSIPSF